MLPRCTCGRVIWKRGHTQCHICKPKGNFVNTGVVYIPCRWCANYRYDQALPFCDRCGYPTEKNRAPRVIKEVKVYVRWTPLNHFDTKLINEKLAAFIKKHRRHKSNKKSWLYE